MCTLVHGILTQYFCQVCIVHCLLLFLCELSLISTSHCLPIIDHLLEPRPTTSPTTLTLQLLLLISGWGLLLLLLQLSQLILLLGCGTGGNFLGTIPIGQVLNWWLWHVSLDLTQSLQKTTTVNVSDDRVTPHLIPKSLRTCTCSGTISK